MPEDIYVTKMVCKRDPSNDLDYIKFYMSDGSSSPVVETPGGGKDCEKTLNLDEKNRPVKKVKARISNSQQIQCITLLDGNNQEIACYNPGSLNLSAD